MATTENPEKIRERLTAGESAQSLIVHGFKAGWVFKVQRQFRKSGKLPGKGENAIAKPGSIDIFPGFHV